MPKRVYFIVFFFLIVSCRVMSQPVMDSLVMWVRADSGVVLSGSNVTQWNDLSGHVNHATQANPSQQPVFIDSAINDLPVIRFDGTDLLNNPNLNLKTVEIFMVAKGNNFGNQYLGIGNGYFVNWGFSSIPIIYLQNSNYRYFSPIQEYGKYQVHDFGFANGDAFLPTTFLKINNIALTPSSGSEDSTFVLQDLRIGANELNGDIVEILVYNYLLPDSLRQVNHEYLFNKYAPPVSLGPDISVPYGFCDTTLYAGTRFTSFLWSTGDTAESITLNSGGTYWVSVTDIFGFNSTDTIFVNKPSLHINDTLACFGTTVNMNSGLGTAYNFLWSTGDTISSITIDSAGQYWLNVSDSLGCSIIDTFNLVLDSFALQASLGPDRSACRGDILGLVSGFMQADTYLWSDNSGNPQILINAPVGSDTSYSVTVTDVGGCQMIDSIQLFIHGDVPTVNFESDSVCPGLLTHFTDLSITVPPALANAWQWVFGDGDSSTLQNPNHTFSAPGTYNCTLLVTTDSGCQKSISLPVIVWAKPTVHFSPTNGCSGTNVHFIDHSTNTLGTNNSWLWDFGLPGNLDTSSLQDPWFTYSSSDTFNVTLIVSSEAGCSDTLSRNIVIKESPLADFSFTHSCMNEKVFFTDLTQTHPWTEIQEWKWFFGDGDSSSVINPSHIYTAEGNYNASLNLRSLNGCIVSATKIIEVYNLPTAYIAYPVFCKNLPTQLHDASLITGDTITDWLWNINGNNYSILQNPFYTPADTGNIDVSLIVATQNGCADTVVTYYSVYPNPHADFSFDPEYGTAPDSVNFSNLSTGESSWEWSFGDSGFSTLENPTYTYYNTGIYDIVLTVYSPFGCPDSMTQKIYIIKLITDIAVQKTYATLDGNSLYLTADILNTGTRKLDGLNLEARYNGSSSISEYWDGTLQPGESLHYAFNASFQIPNGKTVDYACVTAVIPGFDPDDFPANNEQCAVLNDAFVVSDPYPNPVSGNVNLDIILPFSDQMTVMVYDDIGKKIADLYSGDADEGYTRIMFDTESLLKGVYNIRVKFRDKTEVRQFVKY
jgi:PKD repeat protein